MQENGALPLGDLKSYRGTLKAGSEPRPTSDTIEAITALRITVEVVFVSDKDESGGDGHNRLNSKETTSYSCVETWTRTQ